MFDNKKQKLEEKINEIRSSLKTMGKALEGQGLLRRICEVTWVREYRGKYDWMEKSIKELQKTSEKLEALCKHLGVEVVENIPQEQSKYIVKKIKKG